MIIVAHLRKSFYLKMGAVYLTVRYSFHKLEVKYLAMYYKSVNEIEGRFEKAIKLMLDKRMNTRTLAEELGVSRPTVFRMVSELRRRGYIISVVRDSLGWRYDLVNINKRPVQMVKKGEGTNPKVQEGHHCTQKSD
jgi:DNA-binding transcriptional MocR family regulator